MMSDALRSKRWPLWLVLLLPLALLAYLGQDANWDLRNYHLYNPHAWLSGRRAMDIAPARMQTWFNPLLDAPMYVMVKAGFSGAAVGIWLAIPIIFSLGFLLLLFRNTCGAGEKRFFEAGLSVLACTGAAALPAIGSSFNDGFVAAGMLGALCVLLRKDAPTPRDWLLAGTIAGATAGLKLTGGVYCLGLAAAACVATPLRDWRMRLRCLIALACGGIIGFMFSYGYWGWTLWQRFGNPFFPFFNDIFQSPYALASGYLDPKNRPHGLFDALSAPIRLMFVSTRFSEVPLRDARLLLGVIAGAFLCWPQPRERNIAYRLRMLVACYFISLAGWIWLYSIYRYTVMLEMLACLLIVLALRRLPVRTTTMALVVATVAVISFTVYPDWERRKFTAPMFKLDFPALPPFSLIVTAGDEPVAFAALRIPGDVPIVSVYSNITRPDRCTELQARAYRVVEGHDGPLWLLRTVWPDDDAGQQAAESYYGLKIAGPCRDIVSTLDRLRLCPLVREPQPRGMLCGK